MTVSGGDADRARVPGSHISPQGELRFSKATYSTSQSWSEGRWCSRKGFSAGESEGALARGVYLEGHSGAKFTIGAPQSWRRSHRLEGGLRTTGFLGVGEQHSWERDPTPSRSGSAPRSHLRKNRELSDQSSPTAQHPTPGLREQTNYFPLPHSNLSRPDCPPLPHPVLWGSHSPRPHSRLVTSHQLCDWGE